MSKLRMILCTAALSLFITAKANAAYVTTPPGLPPGSQYRLAFVTSGTTTAISSDINYYNSFVQTAAEAVPELASLGTTWKAIVATAQVNAAENTDTGIYAAHDAPLHLLNGDYLRSGGTSFWDSFDDTVQPIVDETGSAAPRLVWTGFDDSSVPDFPLGGESCLYGSSDGQYLGNIDDVYYRYQDGPELATIPMALYAISGVLSVSPVPEPSSFAIFSLLVVVVFGASAVRRYRLR